MCDIVNDAQYARDRYNEKLREAEQHRFIRAMQPQQPNLFRRVQSQLATWTETVRPQLNRVQRA